MVKKLSKSERIYIRKQKALIRKEADSKEEADTKIKALVTKAYK